MSITTLPWHIEQSGNDEYDIDAVNNGGTVTIMTANKEDAAFIVRACNAHDDFVKSATKFNEIMEPFTSSPPFEAMARFKELCANGGIDALFFELARAAKVSKAALDKATHE